VKKQVSLTPVLAVALVIVLAVGYLMLIGPRRARGAELADEIANLESQLAVASRATPKDAPKPVRIDVADVFRLAKAMPDRADMASIILEVDAIAVSTGVEFKAIQPQTALARGDYHALPVALTFEGSYYDLTDFLYRLRNLVRVRDGVLEASGRLYTLDAIEFHESQEGGFPRIEAVLTISAYSFGPAPAAPGTTPPPATGTTSTSTGTTSTQTTTTGTTTQGGPPADPTGDGDPQAQGGEG
jgi:Tfp pilus assembly protein PilO